MVISVGDFTGALVSGNIDFDISIRPQNLFNGSNNIRESISIVKDEFEEYEIQSKDYVKKYQGDSMIAYSNAFNVLKYNHEKLQETYANLTSVVVQNSCLNTGINTNAQHKAGGR